MTKEHDHQHASDHAFTLKAGQECPPYPAIPSTEVSKLRARLVLEEALEICEGLGICFQLDGESICLGMLDLIEGEDPDIIKIADACANLKVATVVSEIAFEIPQYCNVKVNIPTEFHCPEPGIS